MPAEFLILLIRFLERWLEKIPPPCSSKQARRNIKRKRCSCFSLNPESCRFVDKRRKRSKEAGKFGREIEALESNRRGKEGSKGGVNWKNTRRRINTMHGKIYFFQRSRFAINSNFLQRDQSGASIEI